MKQFLALLFFVFLSMLTQAKQQRDTLLLTNQLISGGMETEGLQWYFVFSNDTAMVSPFPESRKDLFKEPSVFYTKEIERFKPKGAAWFGTTLQVDSSAAGKPLALVLSGDGAATVYLDQQKMGKIGAHQQKGEETDYVQLQMFPLYFVVDTPGIHHLTVRYENNDYLEFEDKQWGFELFFSTPSFVQHSRDAKVLSPLLFLLPLGSLFSGLFLIHLLIFLFYRKESYNLHFALFSAALGIMIFVFTYMLQADKSVNYQRGGLYTVAICAIVTCYAISAFCTRLFSRNNFVYYSISGMSLASLLLIFIEVDIVTEITSILLAVLAVLSIVYSLVLIIKAIFTRRKGAMVLGVGILFFFAFIVTILIVALVNDGLVSTSDNPVIGAIFNVSLLLAVLSIPLSISSYLAWRFADTNKSLERQLVQVENLSAQQLELEREKQSILENQKESLEREVAVRTDDLRREKKKSDDLLLNILPHEIAEELKATGHSKAHQYEQVSVIFTDFVNFTQISERLGVDQLLEELNINFTAFDRIMEQYGLEKIKTIGDAYLAVSGLPTASDRHAQQAVQAALDIVSFVEKRKKEVPYGLDIRIGINSGTVIAGIIGVKKFAYDIWGDTVNIAARMEQSSLPGKVNISAATYVLINDEFNCEYRGKLDAKHKGEMDMFFVNAPGTKVKEGTQVSI